MDTNLKNIPHPSPKNILHILHNYGGGTEICIDNIIGVFNNHHHVKIKIVSEGVIINNETNKDFNLEDYVEKEKIDFVMIHHLIYWDKGHKIATLIANQFCNLTVDKFIYIHDYHFLFPLDPNPIVRGIPEQKNIEFTEHLFAFCNKVVFHTPDSFDYYKEYVKIPNYLIMNNSPDINLYNPRIYPTIKKKYNVGILGHLFMEHKGKSLAESIFTLFKDDDRFTFKVFGIYTSTSPNVIAFGEYKQEEIYKHLEREEIDFFIFVSRFRETYSLSLSIAIKTGLPIVYNNIGAYKDRLSDYNNCYPFEENNIARVINCFNDILEKSKNTTSTKLKYSMSLIKNIPEFSPYLTNMSELNWNLQQNRNNLTTDNVCFISVHESSLLREQINYMRSIGLYDKLDYILIVYFGTLEYLPQSYKIRLIFASDHEDNIITNKLISYFTDNIEEDVNILHLTEKDWQLSIDEFNSSLIDNEYSEQTKSID